MKRTLLSALSLQMERLEPDAIAVDTASVYWTTFAAGTLMMASM